MRLVRWLRGGRLSALYAGAVVRGRWVILLGWLIGVGLAMIALPNAASSGSSNIGGLLPPGSPAVATEERSLASFNLPLLSNTTVVLHDAHGLAPLTQADVVLWALSYDQRLAGLHQPYPTDRVLGALPVVDPGDPTTAVTYLYFSPNASVSDRTRLAQGYADHFRVDAGARAYVTGLVPAQQADSRYLESRLTLLEVATLALIAVVVAVTFRSVLAPLITLVVALLGYLLGVRVLGGLGRLIDITVPSQLEPLIIALMLGIVTDYTVFFLVGLRDRLQAGDRHDVAVRTAVAANAPIVLVAGLTVAAGTAALSVARLELFRAFGPGLAVTVLVGMAASLTLLPALMAVFGGWLFWPSRPRRPVRAGPARLSLPVAAVTTRRGAVVVGGSCLALLVLLALPVMGLRLSLSFIAGLPSTDPVRQGAQVVTTGFARGITAPTEVLVDVPRITDRRAELGRLQHAMSQQPGVARVLGPADDPVPGVRGVVFSPNGHTARYVVVFDSNPLGATAIADLRTLRARSPAMLDAAGLSTARLSYTGDTAIAAEVSALTLRNLERILAAAFGVELVLLAAYLRSLVAPVFLLALSALTVAAALGLTVLVFQDWLGESGLIFFAPFATAVLLLALGSDYNVIGIGSIWEEGARRPLTDALRVALPRTTRAIVTAGITLAGSLGMVAIIPLLPFREIAFTMVVGLLIDTFIVRSLMTPSVLTLLGPVSAWPGKQLRRGMAAGRPPVISPGPPPAPTLASLLPRLRSRAAAMSAPASPQPDASVHRGPGRRRHLTVPRVRRPRRRSIITALLALGVLAGVLWGVDALARYGAQAAVSRDIGQSVHQTGTPTVHIHGVFFLPQVVRGRYGQVDVTLHGVQERALRIDQVQAVLYGVHVSLHDVLTGSVSRVPIDSTRERLRLRYTDLNAYLAATGRPVTLSRDSGGSGGTVRVTGSVTVLSHQVSATADAKVTARQGAIAITPTDVHTGNAVLDSLSRALLRQRLTVEVPTTSLPFGQQITAIHAGSGSLSVRAAGSNVVLTP